LAIEKAIWKNQDIGWKMTKVRHVLA